MRTKLAIPLVLILGLLLLSCNFSFGGLSPTATPVPPAPTVAPAEPTAAPTAEPTVAPTAEPTTAPTVAPTAAPAATASGQGASGGIAKSPVTVPGSDQAGVFDFRSHRAWVDDFGGIQIVGEVVNISNRTIDTEVSVAAALSLEDGTQVEGDFSYYFDRPVIGPGEVSSFWIPISSSELGDIDASDVADYTLTYWISENLSQEVELEISDVVAEESGGYYYLNGTATNTGTEPMGLLVVYSTLYDSAGEVLNATMDVISLDTPLAVGKSTEWEGYFLDHFDGVASNFVVVTGVPDSILSGSSSEGQSRSGEGLGSADGILEVTSHRGFESRYDGLHVVGEVTNISNQTVDTLVLMEVVLYNADGEKVETALRYTPYLDRPVIAPGETTPFWVPIPSSALVDATVDDVTDYEIFLYILSEPSPDTEITVVDSSAREGDGIFTITGMATNDSNLTFVTMSVYSILYDADGEVLNATLDMEELDRPLAPGDNYEFEGWFPEEFEDAASYDVYVAGYTAETYH